MCVQLGIFTPFISCRGKISLNTKTLIQYGGGGGVVLLIAAEYVLCI